MSACLFSPAMQVSRQTCHRLMPKASKGLLQYGSGLQQNHNHTHNRDSRNDSRTNNDQHHTYNDSSNNGTIRTNSGTTVIVVVVVIMLILGAGPKSLRAAKSRSNPASPCGNVLPTHIIHHCDNILHPCLCSVTLGFRIFVLADRSIGNRASTWGMAGFDVLY